MPYTGQDEAFLLFVKLFSYKFVSFNIFIEKFFLNISILRFTM